MSYAVSRPSPAGPAAAPRRPVTVTLAATLLVVMAWAGSRTRWPRWRSRPAWSERFRAAAGGGSADVDGFVTVVVGRRRGRRRSLAVILFALYVVLALGLRRGSNAARIGTWVVSGLGMLAGCGSTVARAGPAQRRSGRRERSARRWREAYPSAGSG